MIGNFIYKHFGLVLTGSLTTYIILAYNITGV